MNYHTVMNDKTAKQIYLLALPIAVAVLVGALALSVGA